MCQDAGVLPGFMTLAPQQASVSVEEFCKRLSLMSGLRRLLIPLASAGAVRSGPESLLVFSLGGGMCVCNMVLTWSRRVRVA